jgi:hypothetical protein
VRFRWKSAKQVGHSVHLCPSCDTFAGFASKSTDGGFQDKEAKAIYRAIRKGRFDKCGYDAFCMQVQGDMLKCHWSRWGAMQCMGCGVNIWHDFISDCERHPEGECTCGGWRYYYKPKGMLTLDAFIRTTTHVKAQSGQVALNRAPHTSSHEEG